MADINTLIAELRAGLGEGDDGVYIAPPAYIRALLDHIESSDREMDALLAERAEFKRRAEAAEAELARLRKPVSEGEVKGVVRSLSLIACAPRCEHASECNCTVLDNAADLIQRLAAPVTEGEVGDCLAKLNNRKVNEPDFGMRLRHETADLLQRLAGQVAEATARAETERQIAEAVELRVTQQEHLLEERRQRISDLIRDGLAEIGKREAAEARLREAVEVMRPFAVHGEYVDFHFPDDGDDVVAAGLPDNPITLGHFRRARAFLATLEDHSNG